MYGELAEGVPLFRQRDGKVSVQPRSVSQETCPGELDATLRQRRMLHTDLVSGSSDAGTGLGSASPLAVVGQGVFI